MAKEKTPQRRMMRDAAGKQYPARFFRGWIEEPTYKALKQGAAFYRWSLTEEIRQALRDRADKYKDNGSGE